MPVISEPQEYVVDDLYIDMAPMSGHRLYLKCEGLNLAGSVKLKVAAEMVAAVERSGRLTPDSILVESTSGNLGVALSMIAASKGLPFVCVTDSRCNRVAAQLMRAHGTEVRVVDTPDPQTGFLGSRIRYVREICASDPRYVWLDQYTNAANWGAHYRLTGPAIARSFPGLDVLFVGTGTAGTLMGCARYFRGLPQPPLIVAIDSVGSVTFGLPPGPRWIPGLGSGLPSNHLDLTYIDSVVTVSEVETVRRCREMAARGFFFGGSTGTVISGALTWLAENDPGRSLTAVAISPDLGERYLESVYDDGWVRSTYELTPEEPIPGTDTADGALDSRPGPAVAEMSLR